MIFKNFEPGDVVEGRTTKVASGFWPNGNTSWSASYFENNYWELVNAQTPSTAYGSSIYDVRRTMYYIDIYPDLTHKNTYKEPYFSIAYGHVAGSGSFAFETGSIKANPTKAIYTQYKNLLLGNSDIDGKFTMKSGSTEVNADDIFVINYSSYKMKDRIDEGVFEISLRGRSGNTITLIDDSHYVGNVSSVYQLVSGSLDSIPSPRPDYPGFGLLYPNDGIVVFNASLISEYLKLDDLVKIHYVANPQIVNAITDSSGTSIVEYPSASFWSGSKNSGTRVISSGKQVALTTLDGARYNSYLNPDIGNQNNAMAFYWSLRHSEKMMKVRKSEYTPSRHYFCRIKNREFNFSNNPTYVYNGTQTDAYGNTPSAGTLKNESFFTDPKTYVTTIGLYNEQNELIAVAKSSRPIVKDFSSEVLLRIRLDF